LPHGFLLALGAVQLLGAALRAGMVDMLQDVRDRALFYFRQAPGSLAASFCVSCRLGRQALLRQAGNGQRQPAWAGIVWCTLRRLSRLGR